MVVRLRAAYSPGAMRSVTRVLTLSGSMVLLTSGLAWPESRIDLRAEPACAVDEAETEAILALADRISELWEAGEATDLAGLFSRGSISTRDLPRIESAERIEAAISEQLGRSIYAGSRLEIVLRCLRREEGAPDAIGVEGTWRISRFYGQESLAGGSPMPPHLMPPTAGGFVAEVIERDGEWSVGDLSLAFDPPR